MQEIMQPLDRKCMPGKRRSQCNKDGMLSFPTFACREHLIPRGKVAQTLCVIPGAAVFIRKIIRCAHKRV
jgi:hypothetical protein